MVKLEIILCSWKKLSNEQYGDSFRYTVSKRGHQCWICHGYDKERCPDYMESKDEE